MPQGGTRGKSLVLYENIKSSGQGTFSSLGEEGWHLLSCQPRVTVMSCFVYKVIYDLESNNRLFINPIQRIGLIHK